MRLTNRDSRLVRDIALSHVLSRDQAVALGYFTSVSRANVRLHSLTKEKFLTVLRTPFHSQHLYVAGDDAVSMVGPRVGRVLASRDRSPRFLQHSLSVTNVRIKLASLSNWRFEQQVTDSFPWGGRDVTVRPDGLILLDDAVTFLEVDLGHVNHRLFRAKVQGYGRYVQCGRYEEVYGTRTPLVHVVTVGKLRKRSLSQLCSETNQIDFRFSTFSEVGVAALEGWS